MENKLHIEGAVATPLSLTVAELRSTYPAYTVETSFIHDSHTVTTSFTGVRLWDILQKAQVLADPMHDPKLRVMARASDSFRCLIRWHEFDPAVTDRLVLVAYEQNGQVLSASDGPLRLVVPGDERGRRYLRGLALVTVLTGAKEDEE